MSKKSNIILSIILVSFFISVWSIGVVQNNPSTQIKKEDDDIITEISTPTTSGYTVTEKWKWNNSFTGNPDAVQVEISLDGNYIVARWLNNPNATLFHKDSNATVWIYENTANIQDVAISGDGKYIVLSNDSHVICLSNSIETPKKALWEYDCGSGGIYIDISLSGDYISAINDSHIFLFDKDGQLEWMYDTQDTISEQVVAISGDGRYVISGDSNDEYVYLFNTTNYKGSPMWKFMVGYPVDKVTISDDGKYFVASNTANELYFFNTTLSGTPMWQNSLGSIIHDIAISYDGKSIAVATTTDFYYFNNSFSAGQKLPMWTYPCPDAGFTSADINADGTYIVCGDEGRSAHLLNNSLGPKTAEWDALDDISDIAISGWGNYFIVADVTSTIYLFHHDRPIPIEPSGYDVTQRWNYTSAETTNVVAVSADGKYMVTGTDSDGENSELYFFNTSDHDGIPMWSHVTSENIVSVAISGNGKYIAVACPGKAYLFNNTPTGPIGNKEPMWELPIEEEIYFSSVDISWDGTKIVLSKWSTMGGGGGVVYLYDNIYSPPLSKVSLWSYAPVGDTDVNSVVISANGKYVAAGLQPGGEYNILFFNTTDYDGWPMWKFNTSQDIDKLAISDDGDYIVAAGDECTYLLNRDPPNTGQDKKEMWNVSFAPEAEYFTSVDISGDGEHIVVGVNDTDPECGFINVYNNSASTSKTYEYQWSYETEGVVTSVAITEFGEYIVVGTEYDPHAGDDDENTVFLFNNTDYTYNEDHDPIWFFNTSDNVNSVSISAWGNFIGVGGESTSGETFLFYHARSIPYLFRPYIAGDDDDDDDDEMGMIPFGNYYLLFTFVAIVALIVLKRRKSIQTKNKL